MATDDQSFIPQVSPAPGEQPTAQNQDATPPPPPEPPIVENMIRPDFSETIVVPPAGSETAENVPPPAPASENPFIPQGVAPEQSAPEPVAPKPPAPPRGNILRKIIPFLLIGIIILAVIYFGRSLFTKVIAPKQVTLTYWGLWENASVITPVIADFESTHPKIKIEYTKQGQQQYRERLQAAIERGDGPDVFRFHNTWVPMLKNDLALAPPALIASADISTNFYPVVAADLVGGANVYGIPMMIDGLGLYYNTDLFTAAKIASPPTTWPELLAIVPGLTVKTEAAITQSAIALGTTGNVENFSDIVATMFMQNGAQLNGLTGAEAEQVLIFYRKFSDPSDPVYTWNDTLDNDIAAFANGKVAMIIAPSWRVFDIKQINPNLNFKIAPIPQLPGTNITWASYWAEGVSAKSKYPNEAWEFIQYLTSPAVVQKLYTAEAQSRLFGEPYALKSLGSSLAGDPYLGAYISQAPNAKSFPLSSRTFDNGLNDKLIKYLTDAVNGINSGSSPTAVLQTLSAGFRQVLGSYGLSSGVAPTSP